MGLDSLLLGKHLLEVESDVLFVLLKLRQVDVQKRGYLVDDVLDLSLAKLNGFVIAAELDYSLVSQRVVIFRHKDICSCQLM